MIQSFFLLFTFVVGCQAVIKTAVGNKVVDLGGSADAGTFVGIVNFSDADYYQYANDNIARAGPGVASSGNRLFQDENDNISDPEFYTVQESRRNFAKSGSNNAVAGTQSVFSGITGFTLARLYSISDSNQAIVGSGNATASNPAAIAGVQRQVGVVEDNFISTYDYAYYNVATNKQSGGGEAVAGIENAIGSADTALVDLYSKSYGNEATTKNGVASSGVENAIESVTDSQVFLFSNVFSNKANSKGDNAVAGIQDTIGSISASYPEGSYVTIQQTANNNTANSRAGGPAAAGSVTNVESIKNSYLDIYSRVNNNYARTRGSSTNSSDAVSGTAVTISDMDTSTLLVKSVSSYNTAINNATSTNDRRGNDAVAGIQVGIGNAESTTVDIQANSNNDYADAENGDAVAGNQITIVNTDADTYVDLDLSSSGNTANSQKGTAVIDNDVNIGGLGTVTGYP